MDAKKLEVIEGTVAAVIFKNEQSGYTVAKARQPDETEVIIVGVMPFLGCGEQVVCQGSFTSHPQYGEQFQVHSYTRAMPRELAGIYEYLASRTLKGVGPKTARAIVDTFGGEAFTVLAEQPERLSQIRGISREKAREIQQAFLRQNAMSRLIELLAFYSLPAWLAAPLSALLGEGAVEVLRENPYLLCGPPFGLDFAQADAMARDLGFEAESPFRLAAALLFELDWNLQNGHTFVPRGKLIPITAQLCGADPDTLGGRLDVLVGEGRVVEEEISGVLAVYLWQTHSQEHFIAQDIARLAGLPVEPPANLAALVARMEREGGMTYDPLQRQAITQVFYRGISLITGGPGTGKTTALRACVALLEADGMKVALAAPTGRAAKAMGVLCGKEAKTIHRLLEAGFDERGNMAFVRNNANPLPADVVIVDEASMLDLALGASLLQALKPHTRLVLVGDSDQLPSVGAGALFGDLLAVLPHVRLTTIFRQAQGSDIIMNAHAVNAGRIPPLYKNDNDFFFVATRTPESTVSTLITLITQRIPARFGIGPGEIQVICQSRRQACGTQALNRHLQAALNPPGPGKGEVRWGEAIFRAGDRVMQVRNNYDRVWRCLDPEAEAGSAFGGLGTGVYNGDIGAIAHIDRAAGLLTVVFDIRESEYTLDQLDELEHAFAITTHKAQGSEYEAVVMPVFSAPQRLLSRNLLYTAITRAKRHLTLVGREEMVAQMVENDRKNRRYGALKSRLRRALEARGL